MALVKCGECKAQISNTANKCPHCGAPQNVLSNAIFGLFMAGLVIYFAQDIGGFLYSIFSSRHSSN